MKRGGYVACYRSIWDDESLDDVFSRREAWIWLFAMAAYAPATHTVGSDAVKVERGQMATTLRSLAKTWRWPISKVRRYLASLRKQRRIETALLARVDTPPGTPKAFLCMVISVCNYSQFQTASKGKKSQAAHPPALKQQKNLPFVYVLKPEEPNKRIDRSGEVLGEGKAGSKRAIKRSEKNNTLFIPIDHPQYPEFVADFREATGCDPLPHDGGNWFYIMGEAARPAHLMHLRPKPAEKAA